MVHSMTGFGRSEGMVKQFLVSVDIKSLNGKQLEINSRIPTMLRPFEIELKLLLQQLVARGSVDIAINMKQHGAGKPMKINTELATFYHDSIMQISSALNLKNDNALQIIMTMPEVVTQSTDEVEEADWLKIKEIINEAIDKLNSHRAKEGAMLEEYLTNNIESIKNLADSVVVHEEDRIKKQKSKLEALLIGQVGADKIDQNRLEQELIYYLEKLDINEEKSRLQHHIVYFKEALKDTTSAQKGKKLGFILQEVGREINTMGSKAYDADIQKIVVQMKDDLEKAKEQVLNVL